MVTPSPPPSARWGEGVPARSLHPFGGHDSMGYRETITPHPTPLPVGEGAERVRDAAGESPQEDGVSSSMASAYRRSNAARFLASCRSPTATRRSSTA